MKAHLIAAFLTTLLLIGTLAGSGMAVQPVPQRVAIPKAVDTHHPLTLMHPVTTAFGEIEVVTDLPGKHYWQLPVTNTSAYSASDFKVRVAVEGFRAEDRIETVATIPTLSSGQTVFARAELPDFEGMHQFRIYHDAAESVVEIPRPFRNDANGQPTHALKIKKAWALKVGGTIRWFMETEPNIYATIPARSVALDIKFRERKKEYCHQEAFYVSEYPLYFQQLITYMTTGESIGGGYVTNATAIAPGQSMTFWGDLDNTTAKPHLPGRVDLLLVDLNHGADKLTVKLEESFFIPYKACP